MNWPFFVASELDFFGDEGLIVEATTFTHAPEPVSGLIDGSLDIINVIPDVALIEMTQGMPLCVIANTNPRAQYRLMVQSGIEDFAELKDKKIGVNDGRSAEALILNRLLRQKGLTPDGYELVATGPPPRRCEKLKQGSIEATMVTQPFDFVLEDAGFRCLASSLEIVPNYPFTVCVARREDSAREELALFLRALNRTWLWLCDRSNRKRATESLSRYTETPEKQAEKTYDLYVASPSPPSLVPTEDGVATVLELLAESGRLSFPLPRAKRFIDERYFKKAIGNKKQF